MIKYKGFATATQQQSCDLSVATSRWIILCVITAYCRDDKLREAQMKIGHLSADLSAVKQQRMDDHELSMKTLHREVSEVLNGGNLCTV